MDVSTLRIKYTCIVNKLENFNLNEKKLTIFENEHAVYIFAAGDL